MLLLGMSNNVAASACVNSQLFLASISLFLNCSVYNDSLPFLALLYHIYNFRCVKLAHFTVVKMTHFLL